MIRMISGTFGLPVKIGEVKVIRGMDRNSGPFETDPEQEKRLVELGIAEYVNTEAAAPIGFDETPPENESEELPELPEGVEGIPEYSIENTATELREIGKMCGLTFKVGMTKAQMVAELDAHIETNSVEGVAAEDIESAPTFDAAEAVQ